jgi:hypothetical protein
MTCPYLAEVTMVFCRASAIRKLIPSDRLTTASACDGARYGECPLFVEALARAGECVREHERETQSSAAETPKGAQS